MKRRIFRSSLFPSYEEILWKIEQTWEGRKRRTRNNKTSSLRGDGDAKGVWREGFCNNNVPVNKSWREEMALVQREEAVSRRWQWNYERRGGMNVFRENYYFFFFFFSSFLLSFPLRTNNQTITIVHSAAWGSFVNEKRREEGLGNACMQHSSTETVKFPVLVLTRGALSRCKSILPSVETRNLWDRIGDVEKRREFWRGFWDMYREDPTERIWESIWENLGILIRGDG